MSIEWMNRVLDQPEPKGTSRLVFLILADRADEEGICWPGVDYIAKRAAVSGRTVQRCLRELEDKGFLRTETNAGPQARYDKRTSMYQLLSGVTNQVKSPNGVTFQESGVTNQESGVTNQESGVTNQVERGDTLVTQSTIDTSKIPQRGGKALSPSLSEWLEYAKEIGYSDMEDGEGAWDHYETTKSAHGFWRQKGGARITDWRSACRTCRRFWLRGRVRSVAPQKFAGTGAAVEPDQFNPDNPLAHTGGSAEAAGEVVGAFGVQFAPAED